MKNFSKLLYNLIYTNSRTRKIKLLANYFKETEDPERGYALAILTNEIDLGNIKISHIKKLAKENLDRNLFDLSYDYVGDLAETISLMWEKKENAVLPRLSDLIVTLRSAEKCEIDKIISQLLDVCDTHQRWALIKLISGGLRIGVSSRLTKLALAEFGKKNIIDIEKIWHGIDCPYLSLFSWLTENASIPSINIENTFHPLMLANPITEKDFLNLNPKTFIAEWKWDGIRVQIIVKNFIVKIFSRAGDNISVSFPDININEEKLTVLDGELLVGKNFQPMKFNFLQLRLNRKNVLINHLREYPAFIKLYDILYFKNKDVREKKWYLRRKILEKWFEVNKNKCLDLSTVMNFSSWDCLKKIKLNKIQDDKHEGLMLKKITSKYIPGRPQGFWYKWKKNPKVIDAIMMYAQRGHGKRSSYYSDFTFGLWDEKVIVPICKAYFGFDDKELKIMDEYVRKNTINKFGPVREVKKNFVVELAFDSVNKSNRHKSGLALRFPRIKRIRLDKPSVEVINLIKFKKEFNID